MLSACASSPHAHPPDKLTHIAHHLTVMGTLQTELRFWECPEIQSVGGFSLENSLQRNASRKSLVTSKQLRNWILFTFSMTMLSPIFILIHVGQSDEDKTR